MALYTSRILRFWTTGSMLPVVQDSKLNQKFFDGYVSHSPQTPLVKKEYITPCPTRDFRVDRENFIQDTFHEVM